jgi:hypothetical protein
LRLFRASDLMFPGAGKCQSVHRGWGRQFTEPIALPDGGKLVVLRDAANYITALPHEESTLREWQAAIEALMNSVDRQCLRGLASCAP